jgi:hypothetical protein
MTFLKTKMSNICDEKISLYKLNQKDILMFIFNHKNRHLKPKIDCKNNGKWKLQTNFSQNYDITFTNLLKNRALTNVHLSTITSIKYLRLFRY